MVERDLKVTLQTAQRYDSQASFYDIREAPIELVFRNWRRRLWSFVPAHSRVLEIGVGTGKNLPFYPAETDVVAFDVSAKMLRKVRQRARSPVEPALLLMDAQALALPGDSFDAAIGSFVFCSVPDPVLGLSEVRRVLKPGGRLLLLEHVGSEIPVLRWCMNVSNAAAVALTGANINRDTILNVERAGFTMLEEIDLFLDIVKLVVAEATAG